MGRTGQKKGKKTKGKEKEVKTRILLDTPDGLAEAEDAYNDESDDGAMFLGKEDVQLLYNALH